MVWAAFTFRFGRSQPRKRGATVYVYSHVGGRFSIWYSAIVRVAAVGANTKRARTLLNRA